MPHFPKRNEPQPGVTATLAANVAHGLGHGPSGAVVAAWPAVALVGSYELLMVVIRSAQVPVYREVGSETSGDPGDDPLRAQAAEAFAGEVAARRVPSVRAVRARLHVGQPRAQRVRVPDCAYQRVEVCGSRTGRR